MARATRSSAAADLKRKRSPDTTNVDNAPNKHPRTEEPDDEPIPVDGRPILDVLEVEDTQGLLDRVFPPDLTVSLRTLLSTPSTMPVIKAAVSQLRPISSIPRATLSTTAEQQQRFCNLALELINQVYKRPVSPSTVSILDSPKQSPHRPQPSYALVQHLPSGDYWSSLASISNPTDIQTGNAELVAVFPNPSADDERPTLGSYSRPLPPKKPPLAHRKVTTGAFLNYGPYASFAPSFDQGGELVGRRELGQVLLYQRDKHLSRHLVEATSSRDVGTINAVTQLDRDPRPQQIDPSLDLQPLEPLLSPEDIDAIKSTLSTLEFEASVQKLLEQNQRALVRLEELQIQRLTKHPTGAVEEGSEEWQTAQAISDSLTVLASLRPRSSSNEGPAIIPPSSVLHKLHRTLAIQPSPGWYGTLPAGRTTALRDNSTVKVRPGAATPAITQPVPNAVQPAATPAATPTNQFPGFAYAYNPGQQQAYRPAAAATYATYKPGQTPPYYQGYVTQPVQQQQGYYSQAAYGTANQQPYGATAAGQQTYANYSAWYGQYPTTVQNAAGSGRGTPQPTTATATPVPTTYGSFFNATVTGGTPARTPAVANTVVANSTTTTSYAQAAGTVPTLPAHLRTTQGAGNGQSNYYAVAQTQPAR